ncbi:MAG TPA: WG repeat-containing protein, partial [Chitinophagaceae bacterium]
FLLALASSGQKPGVWVRFVDTTTNLSGYKDLNGIIKIPAKFQHHYADSFYNIIAVDERVDNSYKHYYLLKGGRQVAQDSLYAVDFMADCESEGKILYYDRVKDRVGFLDSTGVAIIPAVYNYASSFRNGFAVACRNASRHCWDGTGDTTNCEHWGWKGGETILINEKNEVLADSLSVDTYDLNWYSLRINDPTVDTSLFVSIPGRNGKVYSFIDYAREFRQWFTNVFVPSLQDHKFREHLFTEITYWSDEDGWTGLDKEAFTRMFPTVLTEERFRETALKKISMDSYPFNYLIYEKPLYKKYMGACGEPDDSRFPLFTVLLNYHKKQVTPFPPNYAGQEHLSDFDKAYELDYQEHFEFLRTE